MRPLDLTGQRFGRLVVLSKHRSESRQIKWLCQCDCGNKAVVFALNLRRGHTASCGCWRSELRKSEKKYPSEKKRESEYKKRKYHRDERVRAGKKRQAKEWRRGHPEYWMERMRNECANLHDGYVKRVIRRTINISARDIPMSLIDAKRQWLRAIRLIKEAKR